MNVVLTSSHASFVAPYTDILLLRDNIQHHLQNGRPEPGYPLIHALADPTLAQGERPLARELWNEFSHGFYGIGDVELSALAMSIRTQALLTRLTELPDVRGTIPVRLSGWKVPVSTEGKSTLADLFQHLHDGFVKVTAFGKAEGYVDVTPPRLDWLTLEPRPGAT